MFVRKWVTVLQKKMLPPERPVRVDMLKTLGLVSLPTAAYQIDAKTKACFFGQINANEHSSHCYFMPALNGVWCVDSDDGNLTVFVRRASLTHGQGFNHDCHLRVV